MNDQTLDGIVHYQTTKIQEIFHTARSFLYGLVILVSVWMIVEGAKEIAIRSPEQISALAFFVEAFKLAEIAPWLCTALAGVGWRYERNGKKNAIKKVSRLQRKLESNDAYNTSSGLSETGDTPEV